jgi:hypothetical protein
MGKPKYTETLRALKLIVNHQESRTLENHNMVKFRALLYSLNA